MLGMSQPRLELLAKLSVSGSFLSLSSHLFPWDHRESGGGFGEKLQILAIKPKIPKSWNAWACEGP